MDSHTTELSMSPMSDQKLVIVEPNSSGNKHDTDDNSINDMQETISDNLKSDGTLHSLSGLYAQIIVVLAAILVFTELLHGPVPLFFFHGYLFTYLVGGGIICFIGAYASMLVNKCPRWSNENSDGKSDKLFSTQFMKDLFFSDISIYLRIGSVVFGIGALISSGLEVASVFTVPNECMDELNMMQPVLRGLFCFFQMHFLFMNAKEMVSSFRWFRHTALMHLVATNIAMWIRIMLWESAKDWLEAVHYKHNSSIKWDHVEMNVTMHTLESDIKSLNPVHHKPYHKVHVAPKCLWNAEVDETEGILAFHICIQNSTIGHIWEKAMPYLYPFIVQYCMVAAAVIYITWSNLQKSRTKLKRFTAVSVYGHDPRRDEINCVGSTRGLFLGLLVLVLGLISLILFFVLTQEREDKRYSGIVDKDDTDVKVIFLIGALQCGIFAVSTLAAILGLIQIRKMKSKSSRERRLTELLQRIGMLAVYVYGICNIIVGGVSMNSFQHLLLFFDGTLMVIQACLQSLFIHQISKKRLSPLNMDEKPGRQVVIFLVFINVVLWMLETFTNQNQIRNQLQLKFYGIVAWPVLTRIIFPLVIFYRFHSAVALMEAWRKSYKVKQN